MKSKATQQITRLRLELENSHIVELREMREAYEHEKACLQDELSHLQLAFDEVSQAAAAATSSIAQPQPSRAQTFVDNPSHTPIPRAISKPNHTDKTPEKEDNSVGKNIHRSITEKLLDNNSSVEQSDVGVVNIDQKVKIFNFIFN